MKNALIIFTQFPQPGETAPGLIPALGTDGAAELYRLMTECTIQQARQVDVDIEVRYTGGSGEEMRAWLGDDLRYVEQEACELSEIIKHAFHDAFDRGARRTAIISSDCPANGAANIQAAFDEMSHSEMTLGPTKNGGYYLVGLRSYVKHLVLVDAVNWGTAQALEKTVATSAGVTASVLPRLPDITVPKDLPRHALKKISTLTDAEQVRSVLASRFGS